MFTIATVFVETTIMNRIYFQKRKIQTNHNSSYGYGNFPALKIGESSVALSEALSGFSTIQPTK